MVTWDNPAPANSSTMKAAFKKIGTSLIPWTKTTAIVALNDDHTYVDLRNAIANCLNKIKGRAIYASLRSGRVYEIDAQQGFVWAKLVSGKP